MDRDFTIASQDAVRRHFSSRNHENSEKREPSTHADGGHSRLRQLPPCCVTCEPFSRSDFLFDLPVIRCFWTLMYNDELESQIEKDGRANEPIEKNFGCDDVRCKACFSGLSYSEF